MPPRPPAHRPREQRNVQGVRARPGATRSPCGVRTPDRPCRGSVLILIKMPVTNKAQSRTARFGRKGIKCSRFRRMQSRIRPGAATISHAWKAASAATARCAKYRPRTAKMSSAFEPCTGPAANTTWISAGPGFVSARSAAPSISSRGGDACAFGVLRSR